MKNRPEPYMLKPPLVADLTIDPATVVMWRLPKVKSTTGLSRTSIYRYEAAGTFPSRVKLGYGPASASAWVAQEVLAWCADRIRASRSAVS